MKSIIQKLTQPANRQARVLGLLALCCAFLVAQPAYGVGHGPGIGKVTFASTELYKSVFHFPRSVIGDQIQTATMHNGYLFIPGTTGSGVSGGRLTVWNVSNPRAPFLVKSTPAAVFKNHSTGFFGNITTVRGPGTQLYDLTDMAAPRLVSRLSNDGTGHHWSHYVAPYVYIGGPKTSLSGGGGIAIWNVLNPGTPKLVKFMDMPALVGFTCASVNVVGNLMTISAIYDTGHVLLDLSDPVNPIILDVVRRSGERPYIALLNGNKIYAGNVDKALVSIYDVSNPLQINHIRDIGLGDAGEIRVPWIQDNYAHFCSKRTNRYQKVDLTTGLIVGQGLMPGHSSEVAVPCGNWAFVGQNKDDVGAEGGHIVPYQTTPDNRGPEVNMVNPLPNAVRRALTSRVGITLTDQIDTRTVNSSTFIIRPLGGAALGGRYSNQMGILNFFPNVPLLANTTYEIIVPVGGIKDVAGNAVTVPFRSLFSTGTTVSGGTTVTAPAITSQPTSRSVTAGQTATFSVTASGTAPLAYQWQKNSANISGATGASHTTSATTLADNGATYRVIVSNSAGSVTSTSATLTVTSAATAPAISTQPASRSVTAGQTATFSVTASGTAPLAYQWQKNSANISGATSASYTTPATTLADSGSTFRVLVNNSVGSVASASATLTVTSGSTSNPPPQVSIASPANGATVAAGTNLYVKANSSDANGTIANVKLYLNNQLLVRQENYLPYEWGLAGQNDTLLANMQAGTYALKAMATDNAGAMTTSSVVTFTVTGGTATTGTGLTGQYFDNSNFTGATFSRTDATVNFDWGQGAPASSMGVDTFSVRWTGQVQPQYSQTYTFHVTGDDGVRLWVNGQLLIDKWIVQAATEYSATIALTAGVKYNIKLEYYENLGFAAAQLRWSSANTPKAVIPTSRLYPTVAVPLPMPSGTG